MNFETTVPIPDTVERQKRIDEELSKQIELMEIGHSCLFELEVARCVQAKLAYLGKKSARKKEGDLVRVWRTE